MHLTDDVLRLHPLLHVGQQHSASLAEYMYRLSVPQPFFGFCRACKLWVPCETELSMQSVTPSSRH